MSDRIRVAVVDDYILLRDMLAQLLDATPGIAVVGTGSSAADAMRMAEELQPDILLLDVQMPGGGINAVRTVSALYPAVFTILHTALQDDEHVLQAIRSGVRGYVLKGVSIDELAQVIRKVYAGGTYFSPELISGAAQASRLTLQWAAAATRRADHSDLR